MSPTYHRPATLEEALVIRAAGPVLPIAGGTDVYPVRTSRRAWGEMRHPALLDLTGIAELRGIVRENGRWRIGALTTWSEAAEAGLPTQFDGLRAAARLIGGRQVQNRATIVGNLCTASPAGDGIPNLLALGAEVEVAGPAGRKTMPVATFLDGYRRVRCGPAELVTALLVPERADARAGFIKLGARSSLVISIAMAAGVIVPDARGCVASATIVVGACSAVACHLPALELALVGHPLDAGLRALVTPRHLAHLAPIDDVRASAGYRRAAALTLVGDLLDGMAGPALGRAA